ncbi:MarR family winged helix-turn-helix transcriptional regulator [Clostridium sp.]|uniref:MarR family winged helix-turn-helix transcriptional regulator n=1 Tax=Clostridium sp. TaxID=1506 RepID=UPI002FCC856A
MKTKDKLKLGLDIGKINHIISRNVDVAVMNAIDDNLTVAQAYTIDFIILEGKNKDIFQKDLEKGLDLKRSSISLMLNNMEKSNLIQRVPVSQDARLKKIELTDKSHKLYEKISKAIDIVENRLSKDINEDELKIFYNVLNKIRNNLD